MNESVSSAGYVVIKMEASALDLVTLVVAIVGAITGVVALAWQALEFKLTGARIRVTIMSALVGPGGAIVAKGTEAWDQADILAADGYTQPSYAIRAVNVGRFPTSVESVAVSLGKISLRPVGDFMGPSLPHRLDGTMGETWYVDAHPIWRAQTTSDSVFGVSRNGARGVVGLADGTTLKSRPIPVLRIETR